MALPYNDQLVQETMYWLRRRHERYRVVQPFGYLTHVIGYASQ
jgi:hypothetical protein